MVGRMQVAGMTVEEFEAALTQRLRKYYLHPQVTRLCLRKCAASR